MPAIYSCDKCGKPADGQDWDGQILCDYHQAQKEIYYLQIRLVDAKSLLKRDQDMVAEIEKKIEELEGVIE